MCNSGPNYTSTCFCCKKNNRYERERKFDRELNVPLGNGVHSGTENKCYSLSETERRQAAVLLWGRQRMDISRGTPLPHSGTILVPIFRSEKWCCVGKSIPALVFFYRCPGFNRRRLARHCPCQQGQGKRQAPVPLARDDSTIFISIQFISDGRTSCYALALPNSRHSAQEYRTRPRQPSARIHPIPLARMLYVSASVHI